MREDGLIAEGARESFVVTERKSGDFGFLLGGEGAGVADFVATIEADSLNDGAFELEDGAEFFEFGKTLVVWVERIDTVDADAWARCVSVAAFDLETTGGSGDVNIVGTKAGI